jgi:acetyl-CoA carboxylase biotin carboxylase subunit
MRRALTSFRIEGVKTTLPFHRAAVASELFTRGLVHTQLVEQGAFHA